MPGILFSSIEPGEGRTTATAAVGALLAERGRAVRLLRLRGDGEEPAAVEDDAHVLSKTPRCGSPRNAVSEQQALGELRSADGENGLCLVEAPPGDPHELAERLDSNVVFVTRTADDLKLGNIASAASSLGSRAAGVLALRALPGKTDATRLAIEERGLACLGVVPEDRLLAGPSVHEIERALHASPLYESAPEDEALEYVMLGPISSDPGQPYFYRHGRKAVVNRFDKMDLHLAALATEPECLVLTGGQQPSPYLMDRVQSSGLDVTVLLAPDGTVRTAELLDDLFNRTRFRGDRKMQRAIELVRSAVPAEAFAALGG